MATNSTTYYNLPVFAATDQPKWLVDWNTTMNIIDGAIAQAKAAGDNAQTTADANALAISGLSDSVSTLTTALGTLTTTVSTINGTVNTITELIGNGTPTTTDKTIIGAINELKAKIDALAPGGEVAADDVPYDNTDSGLTATNVQDAIDELAQGGAVEHGVYELWTNSQPGENFAAQTVTITDYYSTKYDAIWIITKDNKAETRGGFICEIDNDVMSPTPSSHKFFELIPDTSTGLLYVHSRDYTVALNGTTLSLVFDKGQTGSMTTYGSAFSFSDDNSAMIPLRVLGLVHNS